MRALLLLFLAACLGFGQESPVERLKLEALAYVEHQAASQPGTYQFTVLGTPTLPVHRSTALRFEPSHASKRDYAGRFFVSFRVFDETRLLGLARVDLEGRWKGHVFQARQNLPRRTVPEESLLERVPLEGQPPAGALSELPKGYRLRNALPTGKILTQQDLEPIPLVSAGERVRLQVTWGGLTIATDATARSTGALGDRIRLELPTRKAVQAEVIGEGEARLAWGGSR